MQYMLVTFKKDYADEFDVHGMAIMTSNDLSNYLAEAKEFKGFPVEMYFGINECLDFYDFIDLEASLQYVEIDKATVDTLNKLWGSDTFGWFPEDITQY